MITMNEIIREDIASLHERSVDVSFPLSEEDKETMYKLQEFLRNSQDPETAEKYDLRSGIGIAAPQIGINKRMFAIRLPDENDEIFEFGIYNPKIISHSVEQTYLTGGEGCLSVDRVVEGHVPRYMRITLTGIDHNGNPVKFRLKGMKAIVCQHEYDHLDGIMFYDRIDKDDPFKEYGPAI
ncbi:peptide deformylase [Exiguobacterium flavidum]|uniref:peptide deformylase n=1 Tax=Exiguobacterium flavidum TaxID=2184695 RepID=UPI000DF7F8BE|nr:peptide deformylase [Exiguobacterium flavidum]